MLTSILTGAVSSLVASIVFLVGLSWFRPKIAIADAVAKNTSNGRTFYSVKVINRTKSPVVGVRVRMTLATLRYVSNGPVFNQEEINLRTHEIMEIPEFDKKDEKARYAIQFEILDDLDTKWHDTNTTELRFQIYATHSFTGFGKAFEERYFNKSVALQNGAYAAGDTFSIS